MNTNALLLLAPRFFNHQLTSQYFSIPTLGQHTEALVLTCINHSNARPVVGRNGHTIPFGDREPLHKRTLSAHDFLFDDVHYPHNYGD